MSVEFSISREKLLEYLKELGKEFRKLHKKRAEAEIILIGGASIVINYDFRDMTTDADALIYTDVAMKDAINRVRDKFNLPHDWLNEDFKNTKSYTEKIRGVSVHYKTFSNVLNIRTIAAEHLIAIKAMSGRQYKFDLSDIVGILWEHEKRGSSIVKESVEKAIFELYGQQPLPNVSTQLLRDVFNNQDYKRIYLEARKKEKQVRDILLHFKQENPNLLTEDNIESIIEQAKSKRE